MNRLGILVLLQLLATTPVIATDPPNFDFLGHVVAVPVQNGQTLRLYAVLTNNAVVPTPIPLDFGGAEHTVVLEATLAGGSGGLQTYTPATVRMYTDTGPATPHDFGSPATFADGALILAGNFSGDLSRRTFTSSLGNFVGSVAWSGGSRFGELGLNTSGWSFGGGLSRQTSRPGGYAETWDGLITQSAVAVDTSTWGSVKALYKP